MLPFSWTIAHIGAARYRQQRAAFPVALARQAKFECGCLVRRVRRAPQYSSRPAGFTLIKTAQLFVSAFPGRTALILARGQNCRKGSFGVKIARIRHCIAGSWCDSGPLSFLPAHRAYPTSTATPHSSDYIQSSAVLPGVITNMLQPKTPVCTGWLPSGLWWPKDDVTHARGSPPRPPLKPESSKENLLRKRRITKSRSASDGAVWAGLRHIVPPTPKGDTRTKARPGVNARLSA